LHHTHRPTRRTVTPIRLGLVLVAMALAASAAIAAPSARTAVATVTPVAPPAVTVLQRSRQDAPGYVFVAPKQAVATTAPQGPEIVDDQGRPVWFNPVPAGEQAWDFQVQRYRGKPVLTWWQGGSHTGAGHGEGVDYIVDSAYHVVATVKAGNSLDTDGHEFALTPQGTALITSYHAVPYDLSSVGGPSDGQVFDGVVQEVDVATGRVLFEWHSLDHVPVADSYSPVPTSATTPYDYFHINAVNLDGDGNLLISARNVWTVYKLDRHTGQIVWRLGGKESDFTLGPGVRFAWQHNPLPAGHDTIRLFDNEASPAVQSQSRVIWVHLDTHTKTATLERSIEHPAALSAGSQGNAQALDNGSTFVGWGATGRVSEFDSQGGLLFDAAVPAGYDTYRAYRAAWDGHPDGAPTATAAPNASGTTTVHAIWNGATDVAEWRVLAGPDATALAPVATAAWNGLDTAITVAGAPQEVEVVALDARGHVIGASQPVAAG
jgi:hypothetical protein